MTTITIDSKPRIEPLNKGKAELQTWPVPLDEEFLEEFFTYLFETYWDQMVFGPLIEGAAYEFVAPRAPKSIRLFDGYLTVMFGDSHFHLCIGENEGPPNDPTPAALRARRKPSKAQIFRRLDAQGHPISWGFEMWNGAGEPMISIFFASPFLEAGDRLTPEPKWEHLAMWRDISKRYLGREPEALDEQGEGFARGHP